MTVVNTGGKTCNDATLLAGLKKGVQDALKVTGSVAVTPNDGCDTTRRTLLRRTLGTGEFNVTIT